MQTTHVIHCTKNVSSPNEALSFEFFRSKLTRHPPTVDQKRFRRLWGSAYAMKF